LLAEVKRVSVIAAILLGALMPAAAVSAEVNAEGPDGSTALLWAAHHGDVPEVKRLLAAGADVAKGNRYGATPMSEAAQQAETEVLSLLLAAGADVNSPSKEGQTALMLVARTGNLTAAKLLLAHGAQVDAREQFAGQTALIWAAAESQPQMVKLLLEHHADPNMRSVVRDWQRKVTAEGRPKDMHRGGLTPLLYAARESCLACAEILLAHGADINLPDPDGRTPLLLALLNYHWDFAKLLVEKGADVDAWDFWGESPLLVAVDLKLPLRSGRIDQAAIEATTGADIVELLLKKGANPNVQLKLRPPYRQAVLDRIQAPIFTTGATPLIRAARGADIPMIKLLLVHGARVDLPNINGVTPLLAAAGATRGLVTVGDHVVTEQETIEAISLLKEAGADVNSTTHDGIAPPAGAPSQAGETALHTAALRGWNELVKLLAGYGAKLDAEAVQARLTPIDFAMGRFQAGFLETKPVPHPDTAALLKQLGAVEEHPSLPPWPGVPTPNITAQVPVN
jgi:ankyrin repeat protein